MLVAILMNLFVYLPAALFWLIVCVCIADGFGEDKRKKRRERWHEEDCK